MEVLLTIAALCVLVIVSGAIGYFVSKSNTESESFEVKREPQVFVFDENGRIVSKNFNGCEHEWHEYATQTCNNLTTSHLKCHKCGCEGVKITRE